MTQADLAELRRIAEEGRDLPSLGGRHFLIWGIALPIAGVYHWALTNGVVEAPRWTLALCWFGLSAVAALIGRAMTKGQQGSPQAETSAHRVERGVWAAAGAGFAIMAIGLLLHAALAPDDASRSRFAYFSIMAPVTFAIYGIAINASAAAVRAAWMKPYIALSFTFAAITVLLLSSPYLYLIYAIGIALVSIPLGLALVRREGAARG